MKRLTQRGLATMEIILVAVTVVLVAVAGYYAFAKKGEAEKAKATHTQQSQKDAAAVSAPEVTTDADLDKALQAIDETDVESGAGDNSELEAASKF